MNFSEMTFRFSSSKFLPAAIYCISVLSVQYFGWVPKMGSVQKNHIKTGKTLCD